MQQPGQPGAVYMTKRTTWAALLIFIALVGMLWLQKSNRRPKIESSESSRTGLQANMSESGARWMHDREVLENVDMSGPRLHRQTPAATNAASIVPALPCDAIVDEFVLRFATSHDQEQFIRMALEAGFPILGKMSFGNAVRLRAKDRRALDELLHRTPTPTEISYNYHIRMPTPPERTTQPSGEDYIGFGNRALEWLGVQNNDRWGFGVTVAILDTGVQSHPTLSESRIARIDLLPESQPRSNPHGTAVASLIAGTSDDLAGIAPQAFILSIRVMDENGVGNSFTVAQGIVEAAKRGAKVINLCLGSYGDSPILHDAVLYAHERGAVIVASSGNDAVDNVFFPAAYDGVVAVAAVDAAGRHLYFSNRGSAVGLSAPGIGIEAASTNGGVMMFSGTSAATPFASGALAALLSSNPGMRGSEAVKILEGNADDAGAPGRDPEYGAGILNLRRAWQRDTHRIYDMAAADAVVRSDPAGNVVVTFAAQNRGTEDLLGVVMEVKSPGAEQSAFFDSVRVGETVSHDIVLSRADVERSGKLSLTWTVELRNASDSHPQDNTRTLTLTAASLQ